MEIKLLKKTIEWLDNEIDNYETDINNFVDKQKAEDRSTLFFKIYNESKEKKDPDIFKEKILLNEDLSYAITQYVSMQNKIKNTPAYSLFQKIDTVISSYKNGNRNLDDLVPKGRIPSIMGEGVVTEWLHKFYPDFCPMKNKRNHFLFSSAPSMKNVFEMNLTTFAEYSKIIGEHINSKLKINNYPFVLVDNLAYLFSSDNPSFNEFKDPRFTNN